MSGVAIIGAGQAGVQVAASLRELDYEGPIHLIGAEPRLSYQPLSKAFLMGGVGEDQLLLRAPQFYERQGIRFFESTQATAINLAAKRVVSNSGFTLAFDHLVLATGARNRRLEIEGASRLLSRQDCLVFTRDCRGHRKPSRSAQLPPDSWVGTWVDHRKR